MIVNGTIRTDLRVRSLTELLSRLNLEPEKVVVELNGDIISKNRYDEPLLDEKSSIEIVSFVGGG